jgi:hypothetical protein
MSQRTDTKQRRTGKTKQEPEIGWTHTPRIEPGEYPAFSRASKIYRDNQFRRWVCAVQFDVLGSDLAGVLARLTWFLNMGDGESPYAGRRSNYWLAWIKATGAAPRRSDRLSPRVFRGRHARVAVEDTTKDFKQSPISTDSAYSVIRRIVRWETGGGE